VNLILAFWPAAIVDGTVTLLKANVRVVLDRTSAVVLTRDENILILEY
jgi:hypothetical protein